MGGILQAVTMFKPASGGSISTPSDLSDIWDWWEPSREGLSNNASINTLTGQKNGHNWTTSLTAPKYDTLHALNSIGVANMGSTSTPTGGSGDFVAGWDHGPDMSALTAAHVFIVQWIDFDSPLSQSRSGLWNMGNNGGDAFPSTHFNWPIDGHIYEGALRTSRVDTGVVTHGLTTPHVYEISSITNEWKVFKNGTQIGSTQTTNTVGLPSVPFLGVSRDSGTYSMRGFIAGMYLASAKLSSGNRTLLINYINSRFALASS